MSSILNDLVRAHAARVRMTTNADQFEARGEPWQMPTQERIEVSTKTSRKIRKAAAQKRQPKTIFRENPRAYPAPSEQVLRCRRHRENLQDTLRYLDVPSRTQAPATPGERDYFLRIHTKLDTTGVAPRLVKPEPVDPWDVDLEAKQRARAEWLAKERADILARQEAARARINR